MNSYDEQINELLSNPQKMLQKKPFYRGYDFTGCGRKTLARTVSVNGTTEVRLPSLKKRVITQDDFLAELEPSNHAVLYDQNIPSITMKLDAKHGGGFVDIKYKKLAVSFQKNIKDKQVLHLCGNPMQFTLIGENPTDKQQEDFITYKQYWDLRNQDGMKTKLVDAQLSVGDAGLLYYFDRYGQVKSKLLSYLDGYILCSHNDHNGDRLLECVYYSDNGTDYIDAYDDKYLYRYRSDGSPTSIDGWTRFYVEEHGFPENPLITKRGDVAWNDAQSVIESYEILYNIFNVIQKRHGWGILYIKGRFDDTTKKIAGSIILNDKSIGDASNGNDAKFLTPPSPQGTIDTLNLLEETIQKCSSTTFLLPKDVKMTGDISGIAIMLTQSMDIEKALKASIEYQNVADKMTRLFKAGLAKELVQKGIQPSAVTDFDNLNISARFKVWRPQSDTDLVQRLSTSVSGGFLSIDTATDINPDAKPDEKARLRRQKEQQQLDQEAQLAMTQKYTNLNNNNNKEK